VPDFIGVIDLTHPKSRSTPESEHQWDTRGKKPSDPTDLDPEVGREGARARAGETIAILATVVMMIAATFHLLIMVFLLGCEANKAGLPVACTVRDTRGDDHF
jgi:hypothetical protein